jgi:crossover junction endodeoxyribonuclease RusA
MSHDASITAGRTSLAPTRDAGCPSLQAIGRLRGPRSRETGRNAAPSRTTASNISNSPAPTARSEQSVRQRWTAQGAQCRVLSAPAKTFNRDVAKLIAAQRTSGLLSTATERALADSLLGIYLVYFFETPHRRDLDGGLKICLDALARTIGFDDRSVVDLHLSKKIDPLRPRVEVEIETISEWEFDQTYFYLGQRARAD